MRKTITPDRVHSAFPEPKVLHLPDPGLSVKFTWKWLAKWWFLTYYYIHIYILHISYYIHIYDIYREADFGIFKIQSLNSIFQFIISDTESPQFLSIIFLTLSCGCFSESLIPGHWRRLWMRRQSWNRAAHSGHATSLKQIKHRTEFKREWILVDGLPSLGVRLWHFHVLTLSQIPKAKPVCFGSPTCYFHNCIQQHLQLQRFFWDIRIPVRHVGHSSCPPRQHQSTI